MVKWGTVEIPELAYSPSKGMYKPPDVGTTHLPTGLRLRYAKFEREKFPEYLLYLPNEARPALRLTIAREYLGNQLRATFGSDWEKYYRLSQEERKELIKKFRLEQGEEIVLHKSTVENDDIDFEWTVERRDALILIIFWLIGGSHGADLIGPSTLTIKPNGIPEEFTGKFRNPVWEGLQFIG